MDPLIPQIIAQVDYYFSPENLYHDVYLRGLMNPFTGWVALSEIVKFGRMRRMGATNVPFVAHTLRFSTVVEVDSSACFVRPRLSPFHFQLPTLPRYQTFFPAVPVAAMTSHHSINFAITSPHVIDPMHALFPAHPPHMPHYAGPAQAAYENLPTMTSDYKLPQYERKTPPAVIASCNPDREGPRVCPTGASSAATYVKPVGMMPSSLPAPVPKYALHPVVARMSAPLMHDKIAPLTRKESAPKKGSMGMGHKKEAPGVREMMTEEASIWTQTMQRGHEKIAMRASGRQEMMAQSTAASMEQIRDLPPAIGIGKGCTVHEPGRQLDEGRVEDGEQVHRDAIESGSRTGAVSEKAQMSLILGQMGAVQNMQKDDDIRHDRLCRDYIGAEGKNMGANETREAGEVELGSEVSRPPSSPEEGTENGFGEWKMKKERRSEHWEERRYRERNGAGRCHSHMSTEAQSEENMLYFGGKKKKHRKKRAENRREYGTGKRERCVERRNEGAIKW